MKLKRFVIKDLFGYQQVDIPFDKHIKILVGENGLGKTTVLNTLYYILTKRFEKLNKINFSSIELHIDSKRKIVIKKDDLSYYVERSNDAFIKSHFYETITGGIKKDNIQSLKQIISGKQSDQSKRIEVTKVLKDIGIRINAPSQYIYDIVRKYLAEQEANNFLKVINELDDYVDFNILYFPTYRRIEEELNNIGFINKKDAAEKYDHFYEEDEVEKNVDEDIIQFGMGDVDERINNLTGEIVRSSIIGFSEITGEMLHQLLTGFPEVKSNKGSKLELDKLQIILERVGPNISMEDKAQIIEMIKSGKSTNTGLVYFINKLIELYNKQEAIDTSIKKFVEICNGYLKGKKYFYDEREVSLKIKRERTEDIVQLNQLSSGEKQIVSLFSKVYLEQNKSFVVLFDEPELSLSIYWQQKLLPDIIHSGKCNFLLAVTHSPFIYDNELQYNAAGLNEYISYKK